MKLLLQSALLYIFIINFSNIYNKCFFQVPPSVFMKEMSYTVEKRMKDISRSMRQVQSLPEFTMPDNFRVSPSIILIQNAELNKTTSVILTITNSSRVSHRSMIICFLSNQLVTSNFQEKALSRRVKTQRFIPYIWSTLRSIEHSDTNARQQKLK